MNRFITKNGIYLIAVLTANLIAEYAITELFNTLSRKSWENVGLRMLVIAIVFLPLMHLLGPIIEKITKKYVQGSKKAGKSNLGGTFLGLVLALGSLYMGYAYLWYNLKLF